jgi:4-amino-4-deoxy-L-arabinose transferase-like glycosyltransferase
MSILSDESRPLLDVGIRDASDPSFGPSFGVGPSFGIRTAGAEAKEQSTFRLLAVTWVAVATLIRFAGIARLPLANGEAYYASWSRFLDWSYYDHPPLVAWMVRLTTLLDDSTAAIRLGPVLCAAVFGLLFYRLAERFFGPRAALFALVLITAVPVFLISSIVLNPESPLAPLWVGYLLVLEGMRERDEAYRPLAAGVLLGTAFLAKYTAVLLVPTTFLYLAFSAPARRWLRRPSLYAGGAIALAIATPVLLWNEVHGWPTLHLHFVERAGVAVPVAGENAINHLMEDASTTGTTWIQSLARLLVGQVLSYSPLLVPALVVGLVRTLRRARQDDRDLFLASFSWPVLILVLAAMMRVKDAEQHWTMVAFIPAAIAAGRYASEAWSSTRRYSVLTAAGVALSFAGFAVGVVATHSDAVVRLFPAAHYDPRADLSNEMAGWDQVRASVADAAHAARAEHGNVVLASNHYAMCGRLLMETGDAPNVYCPTVRRSAFDFFARHEPPADATVIVVTNDIHSELPTGLEGRTCTRADDVNVERAGRNVARYFVNTCPPVRASSERRASRD